MVDLHSWNWLFTSASVFGSNYKLIELLGIINFLHHCMSTTINTQNTTVVKMVIEQRTYSFVCMRKGMFRHYSAISKPRNHLCEIQEHQLILKKISISSDDKRYFFRLNLKEATIAKCNISNQNNLSEVIIIKLHILR